MIIICHCEDRSAEEGASYSNSLEELHELQTDESQQRAHHVSTYVTLSQTTLSALSYTPVLLVYLIHLHSYT